jgi:hypothetical protein
MLLPIETRGATGINLEELECSFKILFLYQFRHSQSPFPEPRKSASLIATSVHPHDARLARETKLER